MILEDSLFFGDKRYPARFHKQKLWLHRATMKRYAQYLESQGFWTEYLDYGTHNPWLSERLPQLLEEAASDQKTVAIAEPADFLLEKRLRDVCLQLDVQLEVLPNLGFLNSPAENQGYRSGKKRWFMADFYKWQRTRLDLLIENGDPVGNRWSFDEENRKKVPKKILHTIPKNLRLSRDAIDSEAVQYVNEQFPDHPGSLDELYYPTSHADAKRWLKHFLANRFELFGPYEDAIVEGESWLWHSVLSPSLNLGLITPKEVIRLALKHAAKHNIPINSLEGFIRQIIGWREFVRATYQDLGVLMRTTNHWNHDRGMPKSFYDGTTGILPVDETIHRILETGYCHHIERLMVLGGFMFLCEISPDEVYQWFMEMFIDSYDWVMVPNVYAMSQHADGGQITTKPYFSGSSYIRKMSHHKAAPWCDVWDGLYWRWILKHAKELEKNPRWAMMCSMAKRMDTEKQTAHLENAEAFLARLA